MRERSEGGGEAGVKMKAEREASHGPPLGQNRCGIRKACLLDSPREQR